ncbi:RNA polymerase sigma factor [uncultured Methylophaga sp.]|uniref:RNA polymerase sigma factor n=1 Tax=uncultured Methylophaga sp. TaxID=285271 RepID=UPI00261C1EEC|nr:RNA polymerase sigma factor [uncultured Methylophaga sp.]
MTESAAQSLAQLVEVHYQELLQYITRRTGSESTAQEVLQETWIRANSKSGELPDNPRAYLYRMANNLAIDLLRREKTRSATTATDTSDELVHLTDIPSASPSPEDAAISGQEIKALNAAVAELPEKCRQVFLYYRGQGLTMRQIADRLAISDKTVEKHIARAMVHCRKRMREAGRNL